MRISNRFPRRRANGSVSFVAKAATGAVVVVLVAALTHAAVTAQTAEAAYAIAMHGSPAMPETWP